MKYKVGDRVKIKSLDWYKVQCMDDNYVVVDFMNRDWCGYEMTIIEADENVYHMKEDSGSNYWTDEMIEGLVEEETKFGTALNPIEPKSNANCLTQERVDEMSLDKAGQITDFEYEGLAYTLPDGHQFVDENGNVINATKIVLEKKKKEYPKTYGYCCDTLDCCSYNVGFDRCKTSYDDTLHNKLLALRKLIICRDAYWKIAGDWKPEYPFNTARYVITNSRGFVGKVLVYDAAKNYILEFPTEEMRDAFYENFKELIESCKELL